MPVLLEIVSPESLVLSRPIEMVVIPASEGDMGVLEGHTPMIVTLRPGMIALYEGDNVVAQYVVAGGFAEVTGERCTVLADTALSVADIGAGEADRWLQDAESVYAQAEGLA
jgi:F-type H+-transporting ATPase subunit epsilon